MADILGIPPDEILFTIEDRGKTRYYSSLYQLFLGMAQGYGWREKYYGDAKPNTVRAYFSTSSVAHMSDTDRAVLVKTLDEIVRWPWPGSPQARAKNLAWAEQGNRGATPAARRAFVAEATRVLETNIRRPHGVEDSP